jgi:hypothetical protein
LTPIIVAILVAKVSFLIQRSEAGQASFTIIGEALTFWMKSEAIVDRLRRAVEEAFPLLQESPSEGGIAESDLGRTTEGLMEIIKSFEDEYIAWKVRTDCLRSGIITSSE